MPHAADLYADALAMLKRVEWSGDVFHDAIQCPVCKQPDMHGAGEDDKFHEADCELAALIRRMEATPMHCRPLGTADRVMQAEKARGTCPQCGYFNHPQSDSQIGQDISSVYCVSCGQTWIIDTEPA